MAPLLAVGVPYYGYASELSMTQSAAKLRSQAKGKVTSPASFPEVSSSASDYNIVKTHAIYDPEIHNQVPRELDLKGYRSQGGAQSHQVEIVVERLAPRERQVGSVGYVLNDPYVRTPKANQLDMLNQELKNPTVSNLEEANIARQNRDLLKSIPELFDDPVLRALVEKETSLSRVNNKLHGIGFELEKFERNLKGVNQKLQGIEFELKRSGISDADLDSIATQTSPMRAPQQDLLEEYRKQLKEKKVLLQAKKDLLKDQVDLETSQKNLKMEIDEVYKTISEKHKKLARSFIGYEVKRFDLSKVDAKDINAYLRELRGSDSSRIVRIQVHTTVETPRSIPPGDVSAKAKAASRSGVKPTAGPSNKPGSRLARTLKGAGKGGGAFSVLAGVVGALGDIVNNEAMAEIEGVTVELKSDPAQARSKGTSQ